MGKINYNKIKIGVILFLFELGFNISSGVAKIWLEGGQKLICMIHTFKHIYIYNSWDWFKKNYLFEMLTTK